MLDKLIRARSVLAVISVLNEQDPLFLELDDS
jgi:hypothetical protein